MLSKADVNHLCLYALARTFSEVKTIEGNSELILGIHRTTLVEKIQKLARIDDFLLKSLSTFPASWIVGESIQH